MKAIFVFTAIILLITFSGCDKSEVQPLNSSSNDGSPVSSKDGILIFKDEEALIESLDALLKMNKEEADQWEKKYNVTTQRNIFDQIVEAENEYDLNCRQMDPEAAKLLPDHCDKYIQYLNKGLIEEVNSDTDDETYNYSIHNPSFAKVVNEDGLVVVGGVIYQLTKNQYKRLTELDFSKIPQLLAATSTDSSKNILVDEKVTLNNAKVNGMFNWTKTSGWVSSSDKRIQTTVYFSSDLGGGGTACSSNYNINVQCQEKNFWGKWKYVSTPTWINGNWKARLRLGSGGFNDYSPTFSYYHGSINNYWASVSPTTGTTAPYSSTFYYYAPSGETFYNELEIISANWTANRYGGCCGLYATVVHP